MSKRFILSVSVLFLLPNISFCQNQEIQQTTFSSRLNNPLKIEVTSNETGSINFKVKNDSWFTYQIELNFIFFENLSPATRNYKDVVPPGWKTLFTLKVIDAKLPHNYSYNYKYSIGNSHKSADENFQYLTPLANGKTVKLQGMKINTNNTFLRNVFRLDKGDTIFCMRKGIVTSTFVNEAQSDRISRASSVEVLHSDGTIAMYNFLGDKKVLVVPGQEVYPAQPLVEVENSGNVSISLFELEKNNMLMSINFKYEGDSTNDAPVNGSIVKHLSSNIEMELTKKEKKRLAKGKLYE